MKRTGWEVWSSGLEAWSPCEISLDELVFLYVKIVEGQPYAIHRDALNRYFRHPLEGKRP